MDFRFESQHPNTTLGSPQFINDPDLIMLRADLADELGAVVGYSECAKQIRDPFIRDQFQEIAGEEWGHFVLLIQMIANLDPVQSQELMKQNLAFLLPSHQTWSNQAKSAIDPRFAKDENSSLEQRGFSDKKNFNPDPRDLECIRNAIRDELSAINAYQQQLQAAANPAVQTLLITIMNKEKEHVAEFTQIIYNLFQPVRYH